MSGDGVEGQARSLVDLSFEALDRSSERPSDSERSIAHVPDQRVAKVSDPPDAGNAREGESDMMDGMGRTRGEEYVGAYLLDQGPQLGEGRNPKPDA